MRSTRDTGPLNYPKGMKPVRAPLMLDCQYRMEGFHGSPVVFLQSGHMRGGKHGSYSLYNMAEKYGMLAETSEAFFAFNPVLVEIGTTAMSDLVEDLRGIYDSLEVGSYRMDQDEFVQNANRFARITGTDPVKRGRTEASLKRAWESLADAVRRFGEANGIDVDPE